MSENKYNMAVLQAIRKQYVTCGEEISKITKELIDINEKINNRGADTLTYNQYNELLDRFSYLSNKKTRLNIERDIWNQAREICLNLVDEML